MNLLIGPETDRPMSRQPRRAVRCGGLWRWLCSALAFAVVAAPVAVAAQPSSADRNAFDCLIQPKMVLKLGTPVPGLISELLVDRGAILKKGDVIARIESSVEAAVVALAKARAENDASVRSSGAKAEFQRRKDERAKSLRRNETVSIAAADEAETAARIAEIELDEAKVNLQLAQLELVRASEILKQRTIRSPIDGIVVARMLGPGEYAFDQAQLVTISQVDPLNVEVFVPLSQFGKIRPGTVAEIFPEAPIGGNHRATVTIVDQVFDAASGTIGVRLELPNPEYKLPAGLKCRVRFPFE
jgi:RND family efflux transporter MFP subunit